MLSSKILAVLSAFVVIINGQDEKEEIRIFSKCAKENGFDLKDLRKQSDIKELSQPHLCTIKCTWEKRNHLKNGKIDIKAVQANQKFLSMMKDKEGFIKCMSAVDNVKACDDVKKILNCTEKFRVRHIEECATETKTDLKEFIRYERLPKKDKKIETTPEKILCMEKCLWEKLELLGKDGVFVKDLAKYNRKGLRVKNKEKYVKCLEGIKIAKCEDIKKSKACEMQND
ncbi:hypothetical protein HHI36_021171 [Cryptolaemus montrouzieri]|uniref:Uncharacterized protein n=1 Tax=Cryptolaemus montrouzieri TaxID=559131 RepID=A0ABD2MX18_9CUCU